MNQPNDDINHPAHYTQLPVETVDIIEAAIADPVSYHHATVLKYLLRARFKGTMIKDCKKAQWHLNRLIGILEKLEGDNG
ncbi:MAG: DUF3310 domain-containing protein [Candidatus Omnitrophica bacterium]|nr:DUF3310 domain-containing protein [Candidatus Omnitrophota bacterium]